MSYRLENKHKRFEGAGSIQIQGLAVQGLPICQHAWRHIP